MRNSLFFYVFFVFLTVGAVWSIMRRWKRYMKYSNGTYQNAGQKLIFKTELSVTEVILKLQMPEIQDTLYYDFEKKNGIYFLKINGIKRMGFQGVLKGLFTVEFTEGEETYIVIHRYHSIQNLYASGYEAEIYEIMVKKLDCIPQ